MGLWERIRGDDGAVPPVAVDKISPHQLSAVIAEFARGEITGSQAINAFDPPLSAQEQTEATAIKDAIAAATLTRAEVDDVWNLVESGTAPYDSKAATKTRLGF